MDSINLYQLLNLLVVIGGACISIYASQRVAQKEVEFLGKLMEGLNAENKLLALRLETVQRDYVSTQRFEHVIAEIRSDREAVTKRLDRLLELVLQGQNKS